MSEGSTAEVAPDQAQELNNAASPRPFVKWAGGKSQLLTQLHKRLPKRFNRYWEPFIGGGALFFSLRPSSGVIVDTNSELTTTYTVVRDDVEALIEELQQHRYDREYFYLVREWDRRSDFASLPAVKRAARFIFLNKTCFNGLYRVNSKGHFNVPFGRYDDPRIVDPCNLRLCSQALQNTEIRLGNFLSIEESVAQGDLVYFDPPYVPLSVTSSFTSYTKEGFRFEDQIALRDLCQRLAKKGAFVVVSNSASPFVEALYEGFSIHRVEATRAINSKAEKRGAIEELIVTSFHGVLQKSVAK
jgi:DNA adenine methylase